MAHFQKSKEDMMSRSENHYFAVIQALFVTILWSSSWVFIKIGLKGSIPAVTFAGLRYTMAFICLAPFVLLKTENFELVKKSIASEWRRLVLLGIVFYALTQGAQFISLSLLPAASLSLFLNLTPAAVAVLGGFWIKEYLTASQWGGIILSVLGVLIYFLPLDMTLNQLPGIAAAAVCLLANSASSLMGRKVNQTGLQPLIITFVSMGTGAVILLAAGIIFQGTGGLSGLQWLMILWLAVVNTAFAFWLWNHTLRTLTAVESSILNSTMLPQIAILAWVLLDEPLNAKQIWGLAFVSLGALIVQLRKRRTLKR